MRKFFCKLVEGCNADDPLDRSPHCKALDDSTLIMFTSTVSCVFFSMRDRTPRSRELGTRSAASLRLAKETFRIGRFGRSCLG